MSKFSKETSSASAKKSIDTEKVKGFLSSFLKEWMHDKRIDSIAAAAIGLLAAGSCIIHRIGGGMALALGLDKKHATKQVDRLLSNEKFDPYVAAESWAERAIGEAREIIVAMDWTDFADDNHTTIAINLLTGHGRATPLLWKTVEKTSLKNNRNRHEQEILMRLRSIAKEGVKVTVIADRGFSSQGFIKFLDEELGFKYLVRIRSNTYITDSHGEKRAAKGWLHKKGHIVTLKNVLVTEGEYASGFFVCCQKKGMKEPWYLLSNIEEVTGDLLVTLYGKRWSIEPYFRDLKDNRYGAGLGATHIADSQRRDRMLFIFAMVTALTTCLGEAGESLGFDRKLKVNTVKKRTHSLYTQGLFHYEHYMNFLETEKTLLIEAYDAILRRSSFWMGWLEHVEI